VRRVEAKSEDARTEGALGSGCQQKLSLVFVGVLGEGRPFGFLAWLVASWLGWWLVGFWLGMVDLPVLFRWLGTWARCDVNS
jgi:hypothetical protein